MLENIVVGNSMWHLVQQSDLVSKIVVFGLFGLSIVCWTIFIAKAIMLHMRKKEMRQALQQMRSVHSIEGLVALSNYFMHAIPGRIAASVLLLINAILERNPQNASDEWEVVQYYLEQEVEQLMEQEESYLPVLSTTAAIATLLGLFGTVWGLVHAFIRISEKQAADITVVAPGIAEALITTLVGLIVAIPALVMYNYLSYQVRKLESDAISFADKISFLVRSILKGR